MNSPSTHAPRRPYSQRQYRPASVTWFAVGVLSIAVLNLVRFAQALEQWDFLSGVLSISPLYLALSGFTWGAAGVCLAWGLWRGMSWARKWIFPAAAAYALGYWLDRLFLAHPLGAGSNRAFALTVTFVGLVFILWFFSRRSIRAFFGEWHEHKSENSKTA